MADQYEIIQLKGVHEFDTQYGPCFANKVVVAGPNGEEEAEITTKKADAIKVGSSFEAERQQTKFGLKLKRVYGQQGGGGPRPASSRTAPPSSEPKRDKPRRSYEECVAAYHRFAADMGEKTFATTLFLSWLRGDFDFEPDASNPDGPPSF